MTLLRSDEIGKVQVCVQGMWDRWGNRVHNAADGLFNKWEMRLNERIEPSVWRVKTRSS